MPRRPEDDRGAGRASRRDVFCWALVLAGLLIWWGVIVGAPRLCAGEGLSARVGVVGYLALARVCHMEPSRCLWLWGAPLGVCARCAGIWAGATLGVLLLPLLCGFANRRLPHPRCLWLAAAAIAVDVASEWVGLRGAIAWLRATTGGVLGLTAAYYVMPAILLAVDAKRSKEGVPCNQQTRAATT